MRTRRRSEAWFYRWGGRPAHFDTRTGKYCFQKVEAGHVIPETRQAILEVVEFALQDLGLERTAVTWVQALAATELGKAPTSDIRAVEESEIRKPFEMPQDMLGYTPGFVDGELWFRGDFKPDLNVELTAAHEVRHHHQKSTDRVLFHDTDRAEYDAHEYSFDALRRFLCDSARWTPELADELDLRYRFALRGVRKEAIVREFREQQRLAANPSASLA